VMRLPAHQIIFTRAVINRENAKQFCQHWRQGESLSAINAHLGCAVRARLNLQSVRARFREMATLIRLTVGSNMLL